MKKKFFFTSSAIILVTVILLNYKLYESNDNFEKVELRFDSDQDAQVKNNESMISKSFEDMKKSISENIPQNKN